MVLVDGDGSAGGGGSHDGGGQDAGDAAGGARREVRLALVLNGGISLAVWMGGVAHELDLLRRASRGDDIATVDPADQKAFQIWRSLTQEAGKRVIIDVIAGTSAGGLNGMLLATAIGRGAALPPLGPMWRKTAALDELLASPARYSLMRGEKVAQALEEVVGQMGAYDPARADSVTLFLTATALDGRPQRFVDGYHGVFDVRDHRRTYQFKHDAHFQDYVASLDGTWHICTSPRSDFVDDRGAGAPPGLIQAARATASFPGAFTPVHDEEMRPYRADKAFLPSGCVMDGGVLNNEPISQVLDAIAERKVEQDADRVLVYVVPSAGRMEQESGIVSCEETPWLRAARDALNFPRESNMRAAAQDLDGHLSRRSGDRRSDLFQQMRSDPEQAAKRIYQSCTLIDDYRQRRVAAAVWDARQRMATADAVRTLTGFPDVEVDRVLQRERRWCPTDAEALLVPDLSDWQWGLYPTERVIRLLQADLQARITEFDGAPARDADLETENGSLCQDDPPGRSAGAVRVDASMRRAGHEMGRIALREALTTVSQCLRSSLAVMQAVWNELSEGAQARNSDTWVADRLDAVFTKTQAPRALGEQVRTAAGAYLSAVRAVDDTTWNEEAGVISYCLAVEVLSFAFAPPHESVETPTPRFRFLRLGPDQLGPLFDKDGYQDMAGGRKLYGTRFGHFGSFLHETWRESDYAWGRLDAAHHLLRILFPDRAHIDKEHELHRAILAACQNPDDRQTDGGDESNDVRMRMEDNLRELQGSTDSDLLRSLADNDQAALFNSWESVLNLLGPALPSDGSAPRPSRGNADNTAPLPAAIAPYTHAALGWLAPGSAPPSQLPWKAKLLRHFTRNLRESITKDPTRKRMGQGIRRDLASFRHAVVVAAIVLFLLGVVVALAVALPVTLT